MSKNIRPPRRHSLRCAVYTRKSSEEGLEQAFNSLHAQREACEAFIKSQRHEGWVCLPQPYDDGGRSGGNMERQGLQLLLADIRAGKIDVVVVYKIDRLTRSLADFAKIVEIFDQKAVSFVSVTQQFNTTTSMGRLTLNVLLSFAQFEREVTGERIRDKIAASKKKGMWMGGVPPLGYAMREHRLVVTEAEAETVRQIFLRYAALGSVRLLQQELETRGIVSKRWSGASGRSWGGKPITRGALYLMLRNRIYRGEIVHRDNAYPGEHQPIIDEKLWDTVQERLAENAVEHRGGRHVKSPSLLAGLVFDGDGQRMTPTHAVKNGTRYRYYVSCPLITQGKAASAAGLRLPAAEIETLVANRIRKLLRDSKSMFELIEHHIEAPAEQQRLVTRAGELAAGWGALSPLRARLILVTLVQRIEVRTDQVDIHLRPARLGAVLDDQPTVRAIAPNNAAGEPILILPVRIALRRAGKEARMIIDGADPFAPPRKPDPSLIKAIVRAHRFNDRLISGSIEKFGDLARGEKLHRFYLTQLLRLAYLAPDITAAILDGNQPAALTATSLIEHPNLPLDWREQRRMLGFPDPA